MALSCGSANSFDRREPGARMQLKGLSEPQKHLSREAIPWGQNTEAGATVVQGRKLCSDGSRTGHCCSYGIEFPFMKDTGWVEVMESYVIVPKIHRGHPECQGCSVPVHLTQARILEEEPN